MQKFTVKMHKYTLEYELCDYSFSAGMEKYLRITKFHKGQYACEENTDLIDIPPEIIEFQAEKTNYRLSILSCVAACICFFIGLAALLSLFSGKDMHVPSFLIIIPLCVGWYFLDYFLKKRKDTLFSHFAFMDADKESTPIIIHYRHGQRADAYAFAQTVSSYCNHGLVEPDKKEILRHQFANGLAELRDAEIVLFNREGVKCGNCDYAWCVPGIQHKIENHAIRNFFCILFAALFLSGTLLLIISIVHSIRDREIIVGMGLIYIIPFVLGLYFLSLCRKSINCYYAGNRFDDGDWGIYLAVGKNPGSEKEFITELKRRLRTANEEFK